MTLKPVSGLTCLVNCPRIPKPWALKRENDKISPMTLKPVSGPIGIGNRPRIPKLWGIAHENGSKR